ncbi:MAG TPA: hypothetical protein DCM07_32285 [Planctomycetaceae bacterium]|nr:hypothetical protein [Gimesia sp.]HAH49437.1 hypothetical protein [Planctomycetaceae bacterium]HBL48438.1 hypothetical protein [Planctomycetaceae bacterium]
MTGYFVLKLRFAKNKSGNIPFESGRHRTISLVSPCAPFKFFICTQILNNSRLRCVTHEMADSEISVRFLDR